LKRKEAIKKAKNSFAANTIQCFQTLFYTGRKNIAAEQISAQYVNGVLTVKPSKEGRSQAATKQITIQ
jgi:hypothetical protein